MSVQAKVVRQSTKKRKLIALISALLMGLIGFGVYAYSQLTISAQNVSGSDSVTSCDTTVSAIPQDPVFSSTLGHYVYPANVDLTGLDTTNCVNQKLFLAANSSFTALQTANGSVIATASDQMGHKTVALNGQVDADTLSDWAITIKVQ